jgi:hypothetical protein
MLVLFPLTAGSVPELKPLGKPTRRPPGVLPARSDSTLRSRATSLCVHTHVSLSRSDPPLAIDACQTAKLAGIYLETSEGEQRGALHYRPIACGKGVIARNEFGDYLPNRQGLAAFGRASHLSMNSEATPPSPIFSEGLFAHRARNETEGIPATPADPTAARYQSHRGR